MKVLVITSRSGGPKKWGSELAEELNKNNISAKQAIGFGEARKLLREFNPDVIHSCSPATVLWWKKPVVYTLKGNYKKEKKTHILLYKWALKKAKIITSHSKFLANAVGLKNPVIIPNGAYLKRFDPVSYKDNKTIVLGIITNFSFPEKVRGVYDLVDVVNNVQKKTNKKLTLKIVGGGPLLESVKQKLKNSSVPIEFFGDIQYSKFNDFLQTLNIFTYYSHLDNFPNAFLDAMSAGLPLITNQVGAASEIIDNGKNGFVCDNNDNYQQLLLKLINDVSLRKKIGEAAIEKVKKDFDWSKLVKKYIKIYDLVLEK